MDEATRVPHKPPPMWVNALIALFLLGLGGWLTYEFLLKPPARPQVEIVEFDSGPAGIAGRQSGAARQRAAAATTEPAVRRGADPTSRPLAGGRSAAPRRADTSNDVRPGVERRGLGGAIYARRGPGYAVATDNARSIAFDYVESVRNSWITPAQAELHRLAQRSVDTPSVAEVVKLSDEQKQKLQALPHLPQLTQEQQKLLATLFTNWIRARTAAARAEAEAPLLEAVERIGNEHLEATRAAMIRRVQEIPKIMSSEQLAAARQRMAELLSTAAPAASQGATARRDTATAVRQPAGGR